MSGKQIQVHSWMYIACIAIFSNQLFVVVKALPEGEFMVNASLSSPSSITVTKKSSVWLHWNYTYGGDYRRLILYQYQSITYKDSLGSKPVELARRVGPSGRLEKLSSISDPIGARIDVISNNSTLVVHNLQFNDSGSNFSSFVKMGGSADYRKDLVPVVKLHVNGAPEFRLSPPTAVSVSENSILEINAQMDGNPKPTATFHWAHDSSKDKSIPVNELYPYFFQSTYKLNNIPAGYCGRIVDTKIQNSAGTVTKKTNVTVLLKLDADPNLRAGKPSTNCVEVKWNKAESGTCFVKYEIQFKNASHVVTTKVVYNTGWTSVCFVPGKVNITNVQFSMSFKTTTKTFTAIVSEKPIPTTPAPTIKTTTAESTQAMLKSSTKSGVGTKSSIAPTTKSGGRGGGQTGSNTGAIIGGVVGGIVFLIIIVLLIFLCKKKNLCCWKDDKESGHGRDSGFKMEPGNEYSVVHRKNSAEERNPVYESANNPQLIYQQATRAPGSKPHKAKPREPSDYAEVKVDEHGYPAVGAMSHSDTEGYVGRGNTGGHRGERDSGRRVAPERRPPPPYNDRRYPQHELVEENPLYQSADIRR